MNQIVPVGQANWQLADQEQHNAKDALYLTGLGLFIGIVVGVVIALFRLAKDGAFNFALAWTAAHKFSFPNIILWLILALGAALIVGRLIRNPAISYGGADWIGTTLQNGQAHPWYKILIPKFFGSWLVLAFGVSVGSEGPCIQMGAATADGMKKFDSKQTLERRYFILAGCAAGLAGAFSAPFAGICYVYEIMNEKLSKPLFLFLLAGGVGVYISCVLLFGLGVDVPLGNPPLPDYAHFWIILPLGVIAGITGIAYNYFLRWSINIYTTQTLIPLFWRPVLPFMAAAILMPCFPAITGEGTTIFTVLENSHTLASFLCFFIAAKLIFTAFCYGSGIPAGLMVPVLCLGGVTGAVYADWALALGVLPPECSMSCIIMGMAGSFAAAERAPVTGLVLVAEMTGSYAVMPGMLLVAATASFLARLAKVKTI